MFRTEQEMSRKFEKFLKINFGSSFVKERQGLFGVPDYVFYAEKEQKISIISFELKLKNWKRAAKQAFRYKNFSNITYVVLPANSITAALNNLNLFEKYKIGLAKFDDDSVFEILYKPETSLPYSESLNLKLINSIKLANKKLRNIETLV